MAEEVRRWFRTVAVWAALLLAGYAFWHWAASYVLPLILGACVAVVVDPLVRVGERFRLARPLGSALSLGAALLAACAAVALAGSLFALETSRLLSQLPAWHRAGQHFFDAVANRLLAFSSWHPPDAETLLNSHLLTAYQILLAVLKGLVAALAQIPNLLAVGVLALLSAYFMMRDKGVLQDSADWLAPPPMQAGAAELRHEVVRGTLGFIRAQLVLVLITAVSTSVGLWLYGSRYAVLLGVLAGLLDLIPFLGPMALLAPWALVMLVTGRPLAALMLTAVMVGVVLIRQVTEPRLVAQGTGLHPLVALMAAYMGLRTLGPMGFVLGPVTAVALKAVGRALRLPPFGTT